MLPLMRFATVSILFLLLLAMLVIPVPACVSGSLFWKTGRQC